MSSENNFNGRIGFMQGRLSPLIDGRIQAFPWPYWQEEFELAGHNGFHLLEWTLDQERLYENPLMTANGREEIKLLMKKHGITIPSLTGDCFMQAPFYKEPRQKREQLLTDLSNIVTSCAEVGIKTILIPLVDGGRLENEQQERHLLQGLHSTTPLLEKTGVTISIESDFPPNPLLSLIDKLEPEYFGITYDIGNSASFGYNPEEEIESYGHRIVNVHVKDRALGGPTVPLGTGNADIPGSLGALHKCGYTGNYILQTARATNGNHIGALCRYRDMVADWLDRRTGDLVT